jgi:RNA polymerase nonessential primary-like sigma factor
MASYGNEDVTLDVNEELIDEQDLITEPEISNDEINEPLDDIILDDESIAINPDSDDALEILPEIAAALDKPDEEDNIAEEAYNSLSKSRDATQIYLGEIGFSPLLSAEEEIKYARLAKKGDPEGRKRMIESNLRLVVKISRKYLNRGMALLDLIEEGNLGLMKAVEKFDPERGFRFSTYATWWIRQTIERAIMNQTRTIRLPIHVVKELNIYLRAARQLTHTLDHEPSPEEIAAQVDKPLEDIKRLFSYN